MEKLSYIGLVFSLITQIFVPCYFGNKIIIQSDELTTDVYASSWMDSTKFHGKLIIVLMERLKRNTRILVAQLFPLSLKTFTSVGTNII